MHSAVMCHMYFMICKINNRMLKCYLQSYKMNDVIIFCMRTHYISRVLNRKQKKNLINDYSGSD